MIELVCSLSLYSDVQDGDSCPNTEHGYMEFGKQLGISFMGYYNVPRAKARRSSPSYA